MALPYVHEHKYFAFQTKTEFEPVIYVSPELAEMIGKDNLYTKVEYQYSSCNCGLAQKVKVRNYDQDAEG